jgi:hypothetical protein
VGDTERESCALKASGCGVCGRVRSRRYVADSEPTACEVLAADGAAGWDLLNATLTRRAGANALVGHRFLRA